MVGLVFSSSAWLYETKPLTSTVQCADLGGTSVAARLHSVVFGRGRWLTMAVAFGKRPTATSHFLHTSRSSEPSKMSYRLQFFFDLRGRDTVFWITQLCRRSGFFPPFCWRLCSSFPGTDLVQHKPRLKDLGFQNQGHLCLWGSFTVQLNDVIPPHRG